MQHSKHFFSHATEVKFIAHVNTLAFHIVMCCSLRILLQCDGVLPIQLVCPSDIALSPQLDLQLGYGWQAQSGPFDV